MKTRYREIADSLRTWIARAPAGSRLPAEAQLARQRHCSLLTLRRALGLLADGGLVRRVHGRGTFVQAPGPGPHQAAPLVLYWGLHTGHLYGELFDALSRRLSQNGYGTLVLNPHDASSRERVEELLLRHLAAKPVAAVVLGAVEHSRDLLEKHRARLPPLYFLLRRDYPFDGCRGEALVDGALGGWQVAEHLYAHGHRRLVLFVPALRDVGPDVRTPAHQLRAGLHDFARRHRDVALAVHEYARSAVETELRAVPGRVRELRATAVLTAMDFMAVKVIRALHGARLRVPRDVSVTGFIRTPWADSCHPSLTTVEYPLDDVAATLAALLASGTPGPCSRTLVPRLHLGHSTGPCRAARVAPAR